jgi:hypothetical protein
MKKCLAKYWFLIILLGLFSTKLFAQAPSDPGDDPMRTDSAKYTIVLKPVVNNKSTFPTNFLAERKVYDFINKKSDTIYLGKKNESDAHMIF